MYAKTIEYLGGKGYMQYEISNFAKDNRVCRHNLVYWEMKEYIGCGAASHSYSNGYRYRNEENIEKYIEKMSDENSAIVENKKNSYKDDMEEFMFMGLRKNKGISKSEFRQRFNKNIDDVFIVM